jgi:hypothetical protein
LLERSNKTLLLRIAVLAAVFVGSWLWKWKGILLFDTIYLTTGLHVPLRIPEKIRQVSGYAVLFLVIAYGIVRNLVPLP